MKYGEKIEFLENVKEKKNGRSAVTFLSGIWKSSHPDAQEAELDMKVIMDIYDAKHLTKPTRYFFLKALRTTCFWYQNTRERINHQNIGWGIDN